VPARNDSVPSVALTFIREHASEPIGISDVLAAVPLSRRPLELRFKRDTGRTLQEEIWRVRLERAKEMLVETDLPVAEIATRCGFSEPQRMTEVFGRELGIAPGVFRQSHRMAGGRGCPIRRSKRREKRWDVLRQSRGRCIICRHFIRLLKFAECVTIL
jgi:transcriptional regulator GlxA family with amidase domain